MTARELLWKIVDKLEPVNLELNNLWDKSESLKSDDYYLLVGKINMIELIYEILDDINIELKEEEDND